MISWESPVLYRAPFWPTFLCNPPSLGGQERYEGCLDSSARLRFLSFSNSVTAKPPPVLWTQGGLQETNTTTAPASAKLAKRCHEP